MFALAGAFLLSLTFVPAMAALLIGEPKGTARPAVMMTVRPARFEPVLRRLVARPAAVAAGAGVALLIGVVAFLSLGREFIPTLDEGDLMVQASRVPSISLEQSQAMQFRVEKTLAAMPEVALVFTRTGTAEIASDPMPPSASDTFVILKPARTGPIRACPRPSWSSAWRGAGPSTWATPTSSPSRSRCGSTN
jgi:cobalt-zinc-cadmium resistance protein CzcA